MGGVIAGSYFINYENTFPKVKEFIDNQFRNSNDGKGQK